MTYFRSLRTFAFFFFFFKIREQSARFIKSDREFLQNAAYERFQSTEHVSSGAFYRNFKIEKLSESAVVTY